MHFEPFALAETMECILRETGNISVMYSTLLISSSAEAGSGRIKSATVYDTVKDLYYNICAAYYLDCSADILLARMSGCEAVMGEEGRDEYGESCAPESATDKTNGVSLIFWIINSDKRVEEHGAGFERYKLQGECRPGTGFGSKAYETLGFCRSGSEYFQPSAAYCC